MAVRAETMGTARSYSKLAPLYDELVGSRQFALNCRNFEHWASRRLRRLGRVADLACGTGLFAEYLGRRWRVPVLAVDRSPEMLAIARRRCRGLDVRFLCQDVRALRLPSLVDLITLNSFTFNQLAQDLSSILDSVARHLASDALFLFDALTPRHRLTTRSSSSATAIPRRKTPGTVCIDVSIHPRGEKPDREIHCAKLFEPRDVQQLLRRHGFALADMRDALTLQPVHGTSPAVACLAFRQRER